MLCMKPSCFSSNDMNNHTDDSESLDPSEQLQSLKKEYDQVLDEWYTTPADCMGQWYRDCEELNMKIVDLQNDLAKVGEVLQHIEEQSRKNTTVVVGAPLRETIINCLDSICQKVDLSKD